MTTVLDQARALFLAVLLLVGGAYPVRDCLVSQEAASSFAETAEADSCCPSGAKSAERAPSDRHPGEPNESDGCDCPFGCCPVIASLAITLASRTVGALHADGAWEIAPERRVLERPRGGPERPPKA